MYYFFTVFFFCLFWLLFLCLRRVFSAGGFGIFIGGLDAVPIFTISASVFLGISGSGLTMSVVVDQRRRRRGWLITMGSLFGFVDIEGHS
jgi:hypothetical protein